MIRAPSIGIVAPSSKVAKFEFELGVDLIKTAGFGVKVHPNTLKEHLYFAGTDEQRAKALYDYAMDPDILIVWCARGGYGGARLLPLLEKMTREKGVPSKKLLIGYSDVTALYDFVRTRWGWSTLHAPMPGLRKFCTLPAEEWNELQARILGKEIKAPFGKKKIKWVGEAPATAIGGEMVGGNLSVLASLVGTPHFPDLKGKILFLEDIDEWLYRLDRMAEQLSQSGVLNGVRAIVLGNFLHCRDSVGSVLKKKKCIKDPKPSMLMPLRKVLDSEKTITQIFARIAQAHRIPLATGLQCGHGPERYPLPLGGKFLLTPVGQVILAEWDWSGRAPLPRTRN